MGMMRHAIAVLVIWVVLTAAGLTLAIVDLYPTTGSPEAEDFDNIFRVLIVMGMPVLMFVFAVVGYGIFAFRRRSTPSGSADAVRAGDDGPPMHGRGLVPIIWLGVTGALAVLVMVYPGLTGLAKLQTKADAYGWGATEGDLLIAVTGFRWAWTFEYCIEESGPPSTAEPGAESRCPAGTSGIRLNAGPGAALVLPIDEEVKFEVESVDVVHSFWVPAFRIKVDVIPGRTTFMTIRPTRLGQFEDDVAYRVQCAELCGQDHSLMRFPVRVVTKEEFEAWVAAQREGQ